MTAQSDQSNSVPKVSGSRTQVLASHRDVFVGLEHLVLDLDHTLISSFEFGESPALRRSAENVVSPILTEEYKDELGLPQMYHATISNVVVLIKLRPFVRSFIRSAAGRGITLHVYTKGRRAYMNEVIGLIDPDGLISGRRISRDDEPEHVKEYQKDIALVGGRNLMVLDDSPAVWASCLDKIQLVAARRYTFSDKFVVFLRSMERSNRTSEYPIDSDDFLETLIGTSTILKSSSFANKSAVTPILSDNEEEEEDEMFTPVNVWTTGEDKNVAGVTHGCAVIKVARSRFL